jgi:histone arginine demethylase JMJD6
MQYKDRLFKVGEDDKGYKVKMKMKYFLQYLQNTTDDSPLYIFDGNYDNDSVSKGLLNEYRVPKYFPDDLFRLVGEDRRPPYRWFLIGPARSGSMVHIDPLGTSAWNTLVQGRKRWVLFPPDTPRSIAKGLDVILKGEDDEAVNYFVDILPRIKKRYGARVKIFEFVQEPGETVFVPGE